MAAHADAHKLGIILAAPLDVFLDEGNVLQPDILFVSTARAGFLAENGVHGAPDLVVEILSPSSAERDLNQKRRLYDQAGVAEYWIVDPKQRRISIYLFAQDRLRPVQIATGSGPVCSILLPGLTVQVESIFRS